MNGDHGVSAAGFTPYPTSFPREVVELQREYNRFRSIEYGAMRVCFVDLDLFRLEIYADRLRDMVDAGEDAEPDSPPGYGFGV